MVSSRTPEGPLNYCPICDAHCRIEPSLMTLDATCPRCGSLLWFGHAKGKASFSHANVLVMPPQSVEAARYWESYWIPSVIFGAPATITADEIQTWECQIGVSLPEVLTRALMTQNGGRLVRTEIDIEPFSQFASLEHLRWDHLFTIEALDRKSRSRLIRIGVGLAGSVILDYRRSDHPGIRIMDHIEGGVLRQEYSNFDEFVREARIICEQARSDFAAKRSQA